VVHRDWFGAPSIFLGAVGAVGVVATWIVMRRKWNQLPATVPHHFDLMGRPDSYGNKRGLWTLPALSTVMYVGLTLLGLWGATRADESFERTRLNIEVLAGAIASGMWMIFFLTRRTIEVGLGQRNDLGRWVCPTILGVLALAILAGSLRLR
jgi:Protein of unknown function (DUF1648)